MDSLKKYEQFLAQEKAKRRRLVFSYIFWTGWAVLISAVILYIGVLGIEYSVEKKLTAEGIIEQVISERNVGDENDLTASSIDFFNKKNNSTLNTSKDILPAFPRAVPSTIKAKSYIIGDIDTGEIIAEKNKDAIHPIASISKLMTAIVAMEEIPENTSILITGEAILTEGSSGMLKRGERLLAKDLLYPLLMVSSNDAGEAFALHFGREEFIKKMNEKAMSIGSWNTRFSDPTGLSKKNVSTASDIFNLTKWIHEHKSKILEITSEKVKKVKNHSWTNPSHFLNIASFRAGKNGFTDEAKRTSTAVFELRDAFGNKKTICIVLLKSEDRDKDMISLLNYLKSNYGYEEV